MTNEDVTLALPIIRKNCFCNLLHHFPASVKNEDLTPISRFLLTAQLYGSIYFPCTGA
jgi:hypothetical protein